MAISNVNTSWKQDLYKLVNRTFDYEYENFMNILRQIISEEESKSIDYRIEGLGGYGELPDYDGSQLTGMNQKRGFTTIINPAEKAGSIDIGRRYANTDKLGEARKAGKRAAYSASMTVYLAILRMFGGAYTTTKIGDGKNWAATDHPIASKGDVNGVSVADPDAGTFSNLITDTLSVGSITKAQTLANRFVTPDGLPFRCDFSGSGLLLVSPELEPKAKEICGPNAKLIPEKLPESAENGANPLYGLQYIVIGGGSEGFSAKQWAICDKNLITEVAIVYYIEKPTVLETQMDNPLLARFVPYVDFGVGASDARSIIFSNPA